jgi:hypothetical protein
MHTCRACCNIDLGQGRINSGDGPSTTAALLGANPAGGQLHKLLFDCCCLRSWLAGQSIRGTLPAWLATALTEHHDLSLSSLYSTHNNRKSCKHSYHEIVYSCHQAPILVRSWLHLRSLLLGSWVRLPAMTNFFVLPSPSVKGYQFVRLWQQCDDRSDYFSHWKVYYS